MLLTVSQTLLETELTKKTVNASLWTLCDHAFRQGIRLSSNLVLTRLLVPADFGLMQLVFVFLQGVSMFSDLGMSPNLIQHPKGHEPLFLRTAWTIQVLRGIFIAIILVVLASPLAFLYQAPQLSWIIPLASLNVIIDGMTSTNLVMCYKKMEIKKVVFLNLGAQIIGTIVMICCAWYWRSVWTLLMSVFVDGGIRAFLSHFVFSGPSMKFTWVSKYVKEILAFGKWIFVGSIAGFLAARLDRIVLGLYLSISDLGLYGIACAITLAIIDLVQTLGERVLLPLYSHLKNHPLEMIKTRIFKVRAVLMFCSLIPYFCMILWGQNLIDFLYPSTYREAGWMLQILAAGFCFRSITATITPFLYAVGNSFRAMQVILFAAAALIFSILIEGHYLGNKGVILAIPTAELLNYPIVIAAVYRYGIWLPYLDLAGFALTFLVLAILYANGSY
jgi:O-antigen/teichoic acid export membrane protein